MRVDRVEDRDNTRELTLEIQGDLHELEQLLGRLSSGSTSPAHGEGSDDIFDMVSDPSAESESALAEENARLARVASQDDIPLVERFSELKAALLRARNACSAYESNITERDAIKAQIKMVRFQNTCRSFLDSVKDKDVKFPISENTLFTLMSVLKLSGDDEAYYNVICQDNGLKDLFGAKEKKAKLAQLIGLVESRLAASPNVTATEDALKTKLARCERDITLLSGSREQVVTLKKSLSLAMLQELSQLQFKLKGQLAKFESVGLAAKTQKFAATVLQEDIAIREWPSDQDKFVALTRRLEQYKALDTELSACIGQASTLLVEIQSTLDSLEFIEREYAACELDEVSAQDYQILYCQWHHARSIPAQSKPIVADVEERMLPQLRQLIQGDEAVMTDYQSRDALLKKFETRMQQYIDGKKARRLPSAVVRQFHSDTEQRIPFMTTLLDSLRGFVRRDVSLEDIKASVYEVLNDPKKFVTKKEGEEKKLTLRGILEDLRAEIKSQYPEDIAIESFVLIDCETDDDQLGADFKVNL